MRAGAGPLAPYAADATTGGQHMSVTVVAVPGDRRTLIAAGHELSRLLEPLRPATLEMAAAMYLPFLVQFPPLWLGVLSPGDLAL